MTNPIVQSDFRRLRTFRLQAYQLFSNRRDAFFELMDAVIERPQANSFVELSLASACTRQWHSSYKALSQVNYKKNELDCLCLEQIPALDVVHFAIDVMNVRRMRSETLKERTFCHGAQREVNGSGVVIGLAYSIVAWTSGRGSSFSPSVNIRRIKPCEKAVAVAVEQVLWLGFYVPSQVNWRAALDGSYGNREFFAPLQEKAVCVVARTRKDKVFYRRAKEEDYCGQGRRPVFSKETFRCKEAETWGEASEEIVFEDPKHGQVKLQTWRALGLKRAGKFVEVDVIRSQIDCQKENPPEAHWYIAYNGKKEETIGLRQWYETITHRWGIEPANRFRKERLYCELPKVREATSSDNWLMATQLLEWQLYLARNEVSQKTLPWQKPQDADKLTPNRVIQSLPPYYSSVGTPVQKVEQRGKGTGWFKGRERKRPEKYKLLSKRRQKAIKMSKNE